MATKHPRLGVTCDPALAEALAQTRPLLGPRDTRSAAAHVRALALVGAQSLLDHAGPEAQARRRLTQIHGAAPAQADLLSLARPPGHVDPSDPRPASDALRWVRGE